MKERQLSETSCNLYMMKKMIDPTQNQLFSSAEAPFGDVVLSSRARLARNLEGFPFVNKATNDDCKEVVELLSSASNGIQNGISLDWIPLHELDELHGPHELHELDELHELHELDELLELDELRELHEPDELSAS